MDAVQVLQMLPERTTALKDLSPYLCKVTEPSLPLREEVLDEECDKKFRAFPGAQVLRHCATERRYKEVVHQLLRVEEVGTERQGAEPQVLA